MKLKLTTLFLALTAYNASAQDYNSLQKIETKDAEIILRNRIENIVSTHKGTIDLLELKSGEIFYNNEIKSFSYTAKGESITLPASLLRLPPSSSLKLPTNIDNSATSSRITMPTTNAGMGMVGGDGSGGG